MWRKTAIGITDTRIADGAYECRKNNQEKELFHMKILKGKAAKSKILFSLLFTVFSIAQGSPTALPDSPLIQYSGRIDFSDSKAPRFDWPGVSILVRFKGKSIGFLLEDGGNDYDVQVDGQPVTVWVTQPDQNLYTLAGLANREHTVRVVKRTEALFGTAIFKGLVLSEGGALLKPPPKPARKIEIIGDSFVCGYGDEATTLKCENLRPYENADKAFGAEAARDLNAEYVLVAYSGKGIMRNWGDKNKKSTDPFPTLYDRILCHDPDRQWDFSQWIPDAVVIHLGQNDFSSKPEADSQEYIEGYVKLIKEIREKCPSAFVYCFATTGWPGYSSYVEQVVTKRHEAGDEHVYFVGYPNVPADELGCDYHPQVKAQKILAEILVPVMRDTLGWKD